jgi:hypothetical protein
MITLKDSIKINAPPEAVFNKLMEYLSTTEAYKEWHPEHVSLQWQGSPLQEGSILIAEEYLQDILHTLKFRVTKVIPNRLFIYKPLFPVSIFATGNTFSIEAEAENYCTFTADGYIRFPLWLFKKMHKSHEGKLSASRVHMEEEGVNIKAAVEKSLK